MTLCSTPRHEAHGRGDFGRSGKPGGFAKPGAHRAAPAGKPFVPHGKGKPAKFSRG